jgi:hypothetical protein
VPEVIRLFIQQGQLALQDFTVGQLDCDIRAL